MLRTAVSSVRVLFPLIALLLGSGVHASTTYYVSAQSGDDRNDGRSPSTAWRSLNKATRSGLGVGDDLLLEAGSVFEDQSIEVNWHGREGDWVVLGCYRNRGGVAASCGGLNKANWPEVNGTFERSCASSLRCRIDQSDAVPRTSYHGMIQVNADYVEVRNLILRDAAGIPLNVASNKGRHHYLFEDLLIEHTGRKVIQLGRGVRHATVRRVQASEFNICRLYEYPSCHDGNGWPGAITMSDSTRAYVVFEDNDVSQGFGEGFNCLRSSHVVMRGNRVGNIHSNAYYMDNCSNTIVENNVAWGDRDNTWKANYAFGGVALSNEDYPDRTIADTVDNVVRNNLIVGFGACVKANQWPKARDKGLKVGFHVYGNTCVGQHDRPISFNSRNLLPENITEIVVKNNIFYSPNASEICRSPHSGKIVFANNLWTEAPPSQCQGHGDVYGDPKLASHVDDLLNRTYANPPQPEDFALRPGSPVLGAGRGLRESITVVTENIASILSDDGRECAKGNELLGVDFHCVKRQQPPSIGAIDRVNYPPKPPQLFTSPQ